MREIVLIVDDESSIRTSCEIALDRSGFEVASVAAGEEGLRFLASQDVAALLVDYAMPDMDGLTFLARAKEIRPGASRIMISGHFNTHVVIQAINECELFRFLPKPFTTQELLNTVRAGVQFHRIFSENQIEALQRRETLALISAGIVHDLNNFFCTIQGNADLLRESEPLTDFQKSRLTQLLAAAKHAGDLCKRLLKHERSKPGESQLHDFHTIIKEASVLARGSLSRGFWVKLDLCEGTQAVFIDETAAVQMLLNLLINARDAMPNGGTIHISTRQLQQDGKAMLECAVKDTGTGIPEHVLAQIFNPYFSTKPKGQGTGLGLGIVKAVVARSSGTIRVESTPEVGTTFFLTFPLVDQPPAPVST